MGVLHLGGGNSFLPSFFNFSASPKKPKPVHQETGFLSYELIEAIIGNEVTRAEALIASGADPSAEILLLGAEQPPINISPLMMACSEGKSEFVRLFLSEGPRHKEIDPYKPCYKIECPFRSHSPYDVALHLGHKDVASAIRNLKGNPPERDSLGKALHSIRLLFG